MSEFKFNSPYSFAVEKFAETDNAFDVGESGINVVKDVVTSARERYLNNTDKALLCYVLDGSGALDRNGVPTPVTKGNLFLLSPLEFVKCSPIDKSISVLIFNISVRAMYRLLFNTSFFSEFTDFPAVILENANLPNNLIEEILRRIETCPDTDETRIFIANATRILFMIFSSSVLEQKHTAEKE